MSAGLPSPNGNFSERSSTAQHLPRGWASGFCRLLSQGHYEGLCNSCKCFPQILPRPHPDKGEVLAAEAGFSFACAHLRPIAVPVTSVYPFLPPSSIMLTFGHEEIQSKDDKVL